MSSTREEAEKILDKARMHSIYNKHVIDEGKETPSGFYAEVCKECGMPITRSYNSVSTITPDTVAQLLRCHSPAFNGEAVMLACIIALTEKGSDWFVNKEDLSETGDDPAERMELSIADALNNSMGSGFEQYRKYLDVNRTKSILVKGRVGLNAARFSHHVLGCIDKDIEQALLKRLDEGSSPAANALAALYMKYKVKPSKDICEKIIKECDEYQLVCFFSGFVGIIKLNRIRARREDDAFATYNLIKALKPQKLLDSEWINKRLNTAVYGDLALVHMLENKDMSTDVSFENALVIRKFKDKFAKEIVDKAMAIVDHAMSRNSEDVNWVFGDHNQRMKACSSGLRYSTLQIGESQTLEEYLGARLESIKMSAEGAVDELLQMDSR